MPHRLVNCEAHQEEKISSSGWVISGFLRAIWRGAKGFRREKSIAIF